MKHSYEELFSSVEAKANAFDEIAKQYYFCNFGSMSKTDLDTLMFSIYIDRILEQEEDDFNAYSDYTISKELGITQTKISNLKVRKQLKYPYEKFDWRKSFARICQNARFENGKIKIYIPDKNLYLELQNVIESKGGYVDFALNQKLLVLSPEYFVDLMFEISDEEDRKELQEALVIELKKYNKDFEIGQSVNKSERKKKIVQELGYYTVETVAGILEAVISQKNQIAGAIAGQCIRAIIPVLNLKFNN